MVIGWRRAFCTSSTRDRESKQPKLLKEEPININNVGDGVSPPILSSNLSTPTTSLRCHTAATIPPPSLPVNPCLQQLQCKTMRNTHSNSTFSFLRSSLRLSKSRCGICFQSVKSVQDTAIFIAECSHTFHLRCIAAQVKKQRNLSCAVCCSVWKELPGLTTGNNHRRLESDEETDQRTEMQVATVEKKKKQYVRSDLKIYNDDEPLLSPMLSGVRFSPIPESDENEHESEDNEEEFKGFSTDSNYTSSPAATVSFRNVEAMLLPESAVVSTGRNSETCAIVLKVKAPPSPARSSLRASIDLVTVLDVGSDMTSDKVQLMKRAMRMIVSSLSYTDRLSIVAFSSNSKRLLPLRRMTANGRSSARRIIDAIISCQGKSSPNDAVKKAIKVLEDRRDRNPFSTIILMSDVSTRLSHMEIPVHSIRLSHREASSSSSTTSCSLNDEFEKSIVDLLSVVVKDLQIQLSIQSNSSPGEIAAVYSLSGRSVSHSGSMKLGDLHAEEEREVMIEVKVPLLSSIRSNQVLLTVRCFYKDPSTEELDDKVQTLMIPPPNAVQSNIQRLRSIFVSTRALAESRRLIERNDLTGAYHMLTSAQGLLSECCGGGGGAEEDDLGRGLEAAIADLQSRQQQLTAFHGRRVAAFVDEPLTPTSAWRAAERLAKVAIMRKSMNRVGDLHGLENAGF
ncbi:E3 ubiquitin-protein ligase WAVH1-like [Impatiens glandulifera]|uniref:E3 ubiquitin-protein ligase WAVH1-like n=1 Tax=Impatiens glandulifera TaxID=253017 RepID=UPI001FB17EA1|nr:E3 ubiquitin-protein ligase WAVH1-like [Impatiens glandulifera]